MSKFIRNTLFLIGSFFFTAAYSQDGENNGLIQFSGVVITGDSLKPIPFAGIKIEGTRYGMMADYNGFFSFVARPGNTIIFSAVGYKPSRFYISDTLTAYKYSWIQMLQNDTILLKETIIYEWSNVTQLEQAIVQYRVPEGDYERAMKNLDLQTMKELGEEMAMDGMMNYRNQMQGYVNRAYYAGQGIPITVLNPFAWAKFFQAWKNGDFKRKDD